MYMQIPRRKSEELKKRDDGPIYLTEEGFQKLKGELAGLKRALPERIAETARTAAFGDRSDNAEYKAAKGILRRTHYRMVLLPPAVCAAGPALQLAARVPLSWLAAR